MANEQFQARLDDEFAEQVHEYREERHMSKSETVRKGLRELVDEDNEDAEVVEPATRTLRSGTMGSFLQLLQTALLLAVAALVVGP